LAALAFRAPVLPGITHDDLTRFAHEATGQRRDTHIASRQPFGGSGITTELAWLQPTPVPATSIICSKKGLGQQDEEDAIGLGGRWPFHLPFEDNELLA
jgi:hypothetical protein